MVLKWTLQNSSPEKNIFCLNVQNGSIANGGFNYVTGAHVAKKNNVEALGEQTCVYLHICLTNISD